MPTDYIYFQESPVFTLISLALVILMFYSMFRMYEKAGQPGWAAIIPIYNFIVLLRIVGKPWWWILLVFIPFVGIIIAIMITYKLSQSFGKGRGFAMGLIFIPIIFYPILGLGSAKYTAPPLPMAY